MAAARQLPTIAQVSTLSVEPAVVRVVAENQATQLGPLVFDPKSAKITATVWGSEPSKDVAASKRRVTQAYRNGLILATPGKDLTRVDFMTTVLPEQMESLVLDFALIADSAKVSRPISTSMEGSFSDAEGVSAHPGATVMSNHLLILRSAWPVFAELFES